MPLYEYECTKCGEKFEKLSSIFRHNEKPSCPKCKSDETKKVVSLAGKATCCYNPAPGRRFG